MATSELAAPRGGRQTAEARPQTQSSQQFSLKSVLTVLASLRLTVALFALSIILILLGTLAQKDQDVWKVVNDTYFRVWFAKVDLQVFERLVQLFFPSVEWNLRNGFYFFGGKTLGLMLFVNLLAAHAVRFKIAASGKRLWGGLATIAVGILLTFLVIQSGTNQGVESELSARFCDLIWQVLRASLAAISLAGVYGLIFWGKSGKLKSVEWWLAVVTVVILAGLTVYLLTHPDARLDNSGIRILWQLAKATAPGLVLLAGCYMVFRKRAGIVLLHGGIGLIMLTELFTAVAAVESQMAIPNGATTSYSSDVRTSELSVIDHSQVDQDQVTVVPREALIANVGSGQRIDDPALPFTIQVLRWLQNSELRMPSPGEKNPATAGLGTARIADAEAGATGVGDSADKIDMPSAYVELFSKKSGNSLGTYLISQQFIDNERRAIEQPVEVDGKKYDVALRFKRIYHPFSVTLKKFDMSHYVGTKTAKNYSSLVNFRDPQNNVDRDVSIWMNNPLRYAGTTLYQQSWLTNMVSGEPSGTILQVVTNPSWMTPYVGCMLVSIAMVAHFGTMLVRFQRRRNEAIDEESRVGTAHQESGRGERRRKKNDLVGGAVPTRWPTFAKWFPTLVVLLFAGYLVGKSHMPESTPSEARIYEFGKLPLVYEGRVKPFDTLARNSLQVLSSHQEWGIWNEADGTVTGKLPAIRWLLDVISNKEGGNDHQVFAIDNLDLLSALDLKFRPGFRRYSYTEIMKKRSSAANAPDGSEFQTQVRLAAQTPEKNRSLYQAKVMELARKTQFYEVLVMSFRSPPLVADEKQIAESFQRAQALIAQLNEAGAPHVVPPTAADASWSILMQADLDYMRNKALNQPLNPATAVLSEMLAAYARDDVATFNQQLIAYRDILGRYERSLEQNAPLLASSGVAKAEIMSQAKSDFEVFFNQFSPFYYAMVLYLIAFVFGILSWIGWTQPLRKSSIWLLWLTFALHTFALVARIYISGRPPITNLYSTAIFIGWAVVLMSLIFESIYRLGLGNIVAAVIGFLSLFLAYNLSLDGDTFIVLQAVLDTQFWLATHVVTINLGYAGTYAAGAWGIIYIMFGYVFPVLDDDARHKVLRTLYGTLCFAIFFSFIGTVLGGLWADDSWGRFWGWDPKENGALMIVLWNALVLHARWGGMVKGRGLATLAVLGNIVTTWSYFGVNAYGVGLHAYGNSGSSIAMWLLAFGATQLAIAGLGIVPAEWFGAFGASRSKTVTT